MHQCAGTQQSRSNFTISLNRCAQRRVTLMYSHVIGITIDGIVTAMKRRRTFAISKSLIQFIRGINRRNNRDGRRRAVFDQRSGTEGRQ